MNEQYGYEHCHSPGPSADGAGAAPPRFCDGPCPAGAGEPDRAPVCSGQDPERGYFWRCRLCMLLHEGFATAEAARVMLRAHCELRYVEHCVGVAVRRKRAAGEHGDLTRAELSAALRDDPAAG
ncbi:hypothetical protein OTB20_41425 [Streptomyces sp. H27-H1]|uniref:hypothetical protein n=1 Tax=Streptomyces sp. H27-H1 TaxID=2996461 RepID=UPI00226F2D95|nr:hypothetical protein [Streptomyces sp. H27-H1]MCY0932488.1 hypothetical protein [Streptomyces sp. H27-H1]